MQKSELVSAMQSNGITIEDLFSVANEALKRGDWCVWQNMMFAILMLQGEG